MVLYLITIPIGEIHTFWEHSKKQYWGVLYKTFDWPYGIQWYIKDNSEMLNWVIISIIGFRFARKVGNKLLTIIALLYVIWRIADIGLYWINYKTYGYGYVYIGLVVLGLVIYIKWKQ
jgi:hypothetical protein